ncbi:PBP1A family penicillin-binding protein [Inquilinus sp. CAU 1745]|uniref:transglycosylase domain-containing protein n=1 Tax=Inquilinus sp. CAU 1745 TaxID=3140369 RepID=UPI00325A7EC5
MTSRLSAGNRSRPSARPARKAAKEAKPARRSNRGGAGGGSGRGRRRTPARSRPRRFGWRAVGKWSALAAVWGGVFMFGVLAWFAYDLPPIDDVAMPERRPAVTVLAQDGSTIARYGDLTGDTVRVDEMPDHLVQAVLAIEDRRFYSHFGLDPLGLARAAVANFRAGRVVQGGSTITQQLAKILFLTPERTYRRKVQEAMLAVWLEANYTKDEILSAYMNRVYLGAGTYGFDAAAKAYFGVPASAVNLRQGAILAGLLKAPSRYSPASSPLLARQRSELVLTAMVDAGYVTREDLARLDDIPPVPRRRPGAGQGGRYFGNWIADAVPDYVGSTAGDVRVATTLDRELQVLAERVVAEHLARSGEEGRVGQAALVALSHDGSVVAMVGGRSYDQSQFNRAVQARRQPGSAFKPFVYLAALEQGLRPYESVLDAPIDISGYSPENYGGGYLGPITATEALARSANTAAVRVLERAGVGNVIDVAKRLGISSPLGEDLSLALGTSEVTLLELTGAYAGLARGGQAVWPHAIETITDRSGEMIYQRQGDGPGETVRPWHVSELNRMMSAVLDIGTGRAAEIGRPAAGKTGTTQNYRDAWFLGYTADYTVGVWVGNDDGQPMNRVTGGGLPARIWHDFMVAAHEGLPPRPIPGLETPVQPPDIPMASAASAAIPVSTQPASGRDEGGFAALLRDLLGN